MAPSRRNKIGKGMFGGPNKVENILRLLKEADTELIPAVKEIQENDGNQKDNLTPIFEKLKEANDHAKGIDFKKVPPSKPIPYNEGMELISSIDKKLGYREDGDDDEKVNDKYNQMEKENKDMFGDISPNITLLSIKEKVIDGKQYQSAGKRHTRRKRGKSSKRKSSKKLRKTKRRKRTTIRKKK